MWHRDALPGDAMGYWLLGLGQWVGFSSSGQCVVNASCRRNVAVSMPYSSEPSTTLRERQSVFQTMIVAGHRCDVRFHGCVANAPLSRRLGQHEYLWTSQLSEPFRKAGSPCVRDTEPTSNWRLTQ